MAPGLPLLPYQDYSELRSSSVGMLRIPRVEPPLLRSGTVLILIRMLKPGRADARPGFKVALPGLFGTSSLISRFVAALLARVEPFRVLRTLDGSHSEVKTNRSSPTTANAVVGLLSCPTRIRTWNLLIQSQALCQLSYRAGFVWGAKFTMQPRALPVLRV